MTCKMCLERGKTWKGDDPKCAFEGDFNNNWHCATLDAIRGICSPWHLDPYCKGESDGLCVEYCGDNWYATIKIDEVYAPDWLGYTLWVQWYKFRAHTDQVLILDHEGARVPTEEELLAIIDYYKKKEDVDD